MIGSSVRPHSLSHLDEAIELALVADRPGRCGLAPLETEQRHRDGPAVVDAADDVLLRAASVGVEDLVELALAGDHLDRTHLDAGLVHRHQQERDALVLRRVGVGASEREDVVGEMAGRGPDLLTVEHPFVTVEFGLEPDVAEIGAGVRFGVPLAPRVRAGQHPRDVVRLLLLGSPQQQRVAEHLDAEQIVRTAGRHSGSGELLGQDDLLGRAQPRSAVLDRPARSEVVRLVQRLAPFGHELEDGVAFERTESPSSSTAASRRGMPAPSRDTPRPLGSRWVPSAGG